MNTTRIVTIATGIALLVGLGAAGGYWIAKRSPAQQTSQAMDSAGAAEPGGKQVLYWFDPMRPEQHFDKPGKSPFMDMELVPKYAGDGINGTDVRIDPTLIQNMGVRLASVTLGKLDDTVDATGTLTYNDRDVTIVQARTGGIVERVYARAPNDLVEAGAPLVDVRVPDWYSAQAEFLALRRSGDPLLVSAAHDRLLQLGMTASLVARVEQTGTPQSILTIGFPQEGALQELGVRQGMTVMSGQTLARINGLKTVWLDVDVPEDQAGALTVGAPVAAKFAAWPGQEIAGRITALLPEVNRDARTVRVRAELPNPERQLRPGMFARVRIGSTAARERLLVPSEAVIATGMRYVVLVAEGEGRFRPVEIKIGKERDGKTEVLSGLKAGDQVVTSGQFLIDSEASLQGVLARMESRSQGNTPEGKTEKQAAIHEAQGKIQELNGTKIKLAHGPVPSLQWPAMTMSFQLKDAGLANGLKPGDSVKFAFRQSGDDYIIEQIEKAEGQR